MSIKRKILLIARDLLLVIGIISVGLWWQKRNLLPTGSESSVPNFNLREVESGEAYTRDGLRGKNTLVYFFAPWCGVCKVSISNLQKLEESIDHQNDQILAIALSYESANEILDYKKKHRLTMPVLLGDEGIAQAFKISAFPTYYVWNSSAKITARDVGYSTSLGLRWRLGSYFDF